MIKRVFFAAIAAGLAAGVLISVVQQFTTTPLIIHAEEFEGTAHGAALHFVHADVPGETGLWAPRGGLERALYTGLVNVLTGVGFAMLIVAAFTLHGRAVDAKTGVLWGAAGFTVFTLAPVLGLPPELPGTIAAELEARQIWWAMAAGATALGLGLLVFGKAVALKALGVVIIAAPHIFGAPRPDEIGGNVPPELAGHFAAASIVVSAIFWALLGWLSATFYRRFE